MNVDLIVGFALLIAGLASAAILIVLEEIRQIRDRRAGS